MRTVSAKAVVSPNLELKVKLPPGIPPGEHDVVVVIDEKLASKGSPVRKLRFASHKSTLTNAQDTFRRESIYGDEAR